MPGHVAAAVKKRAVAVGLGSCSPGEAQPGVTLFREIARALYQRDYADPP